MTANTKTWMLWGALILTLWLVWKTEPKDDVRVVMPTRSLGSAVLPDQHPSHIATLDLQTREIPPSAGNLFPPTYVPAPKVLNKVVTKPPPPMAPPLPFKYLGRWKEDGKLTVMLLANNELLAVKQGDNLLNAYQLTELTESNFGLKVGFMYQPLKQMQYLDVGKAKDE